MQGCFGDRSRALPCSSVGQRPTLVARTNVGPGVGAGHLARCLALAAGWQARGGASTIVAPPLPAPWGDRVARAGVEWRPVDSLPGEADWFVADDYHLDQAQRAALREGGRLLVIDDFAESGTVEADLVLDQNAGASADDYRTNPVLVGPRYALLGSDFQDVPPRGVRPSVETVLVGLGGFPSTELTSFTRAVLDRWAPKANVVLLDGSQDVHDLVLAADLALAAAGSFCWQLCRAGVPSVLTPLNRNQRRLAEGIVHAGAALAIRQPSPAEVDAAVEMLAALERDAAQRELMASAGQRLVDGRGVSRVVTRLRAALVDLRPVEASDAELLFGWANDARTRAASFSSERIDWETHVTWLDARLRSATDRLWIGSHSGEVLGLVRFDAPATGCADIGVTVAPASRGVGWAAPLIDAGVRRVFATGMVNEVIARIRPENEASIRAFESADFEHRASSDAASLELVRRYDAA